MHGHAKKKWSRVETRATNSVWEDKNFFLNAAEASDAFGGRYDELAARNSTLGHL